MGLKLVELLAIYLGVAGLGLVVAASFVHSVIAGMFVTGGLFLLVATTVLYAVAARERAALAAAKPAESLRAA